MFPAKRTKPGMSPPRSVSILTSARITCSARHLIVNCVSVSHSGVRLPRDDDLENEQERERFLLPVIQSNDMDNWETITEGEKLTTWQELSEIFQIAIPTAMGNLSEFLPITFAMGMVGQMNVGGNGLQLDALAMANSYWNMTGLAVQYGLNSAMRTLSPQAVGSGRSRQIFESTCRTVN